MENARVRVEFSDTYQRLNKNRTGKVSIFHTVMCLFHGY